MRLRRVPFRILNTIQGLLWMDMQKQNSVQLVILPMTYGNACGGMLKSARTPYQQAPAISANISTAANSQSRFIPSKNT